MMLTFAPACICCQFQISNESKLVSNSISAELLKWASWKKGNNQQSESSIETTKSLFFLISVFLPPPFVGAHHLLFPTRPKCQTPGTGVCCIFRHLAKLPMTKTTPSTIYFKPVWEAAWNKKTCIIHCGPFCVPGHTAKAQLAPSHTAGVWKRTDNARHWFSKWGPETPMGSLREFQWVPS